MNDWLASVPRLSQLPQLSSIYIDQSETTRRGQGPWLETKQKTSTSKLKSLRIEVNSKEIDKVTSHK